MKKLFQKSLALLAMLMVSVGMWGIQFCGTTPYASTDAAGPSIYLTVSKTDNVYTMKAVSATKDSYITGLLGDNMFCYTNNGTANCHMAASGNYSYDATEHSVTFTVTSTAAPKIYTSLAFTFNTGNYTFTSANSLAWEACTGEVVPGPTANPTAPTYAANKVKAVYSATYNADCGFGEWGSGTTYEQETYGKKFVVGQSQNGYMGLTFSGLDCSTMEKLHMDVYPLENISFKVFPIWGGTEQGIMTSTLTANQWNSVDIDLSSYNVITNWSNIYQIKIDEAKGKTFWLNNIYFYTTAAEVDSEAPTMTSATLVSKTHNSAVISVAATDNVGVSEYIVKNGDTQLFEGAATNGKITVTGLSAATDYALTIYAKDAAGNVSSGLPMAQFTTENLIYNRFAIGHLGQADFADPNGQILLTLEKVNSTTVRVLAEPKNAGTIVDFVWVNFNGKTGQIGESSATSTTNIGAITLSDVTISDQFTVCVNWHTLSMGAAGAWTTQNFTVKSSELYVAVADNQAPTWNEDPTASNVTHNTAVINVNAQDETELVGYVFSGDIEGLKTATDGKIYLSGLTAETAYSIAIQAKDATGNLSTSKPVTFTTEAAPVSPYCQTQVTHFNIAAETSSAFYLSVGRSGDKMKVKAQALSEDALLDYIDVPGKVSKTPETPCETLEVEFTATPNADGNVVFTLLWSNTKSGGNWQLNDVTVNADAICDFAAEAAVSSVELSKTTLNLVEGNSETLTATVKPSLVSDKTVTWSVESGSSYASVDATGKVTAIAAGTAVVRATSNADATKYAECTVNVSGAVVESKTYNDYVSQNNVYILYAITRNVDKTLTFSAQISTKHSVEYGQVYFGGGNFKNFTKSGDVYSYTTTDTYEQGEVKNWQFHLVGPSGFDRYIDFSYTVGSEQAVPAVAVEEVVISQPTASLTVGEDLQLTAKAYPSFAANTTITWAVESGSSAGVSAAGMVHANTAGETVIKAYNGEKKATCTVNVEAQLELATYYGRTVLSFGKNRVAANWSVTRNLDRKLEYKVVFDEDVTGKIMQLKNDNDNFVGLDYDAATKTATKTSSSTYADGVTISGEHILYFGGSRIELGSYVIGSSNTAPVNSLVAFGEGTDNSAKLTAYNGETVDVKINRSLTAGESWKTLCLPFSMTADQIAETFGDCEIRELAEAHWKTVDVEMYIRFDQVHAIEAGKPYLIRLSEDKSSLNFSGVTINSATPAATTLAGFISMSGTYVSETMNADDYFLATDNYLYRAGAQSEIPTLPAFRCYFRFNTASGVAPRARAIFNTQVTTDVENVLTDEQVQKYIKDGSLFILRGGRLYDANGRLVK